MSIAIATKGHIATGSGQALPPTKIAGVNAEEINNIIRCNFQEKIIDVLTSPALPTQYDNAPFEKPENSEWCRLTINHGETKLVEFGGSTTYRTVGIMVAQLFSPIMKGNLDLHTVAEQININFRSVNYDGVQFKTPSIGKERRMEKEWMMNVSCPFFADQIV